MWPFRSDVQRALKGRIDFLVITPLKDKFRRYANTYRPSRKSNFPGICGSTSGLSTSDETADEELRRYSYQVVVLPLRGMGNKRATSAAKDSIRRFPAAVRIARRHCWRN